MRYSTLRQIVTETETRARGLAANSGSRTAVYEVALVSLRLALAESEQPRAWERVALTLADLRERLPVDALDAIAAEQAWRRLALLADLPEVTGFSSYKDIVDLIGEVINVGAPRYNSGDLRGCAALYWMTTRLISETPATRGFPGYARLQGHLKSLADAEAHVGTMSHAEADAWAWELRHALDATVRVATP